MFILTRMPFNCITTKQHKILLHRKTIIQTINFVVNELKMNNKLSIEIHTALNS
jgi:hypothetical protein